MKYNPCPVCSNINIQLVNRYKILEDKKIPQLNIECMNCGFSLVSAPFHVTNEYIKKNTDSDQNKFEWNSAIQYITIKK